MYTGRLTLTFQGKGKQEWKNYEENSMYSQTEFQFIYLTLTALSTGRAATSKTREFEKRNCWWIQTPVQWKKLLFWMQKED